MHIQWATNQEVSKLLGTPLGLSISSSQIDNALLQRLDKKFNYWSQAKINSAGRAIIANAVLVSSLLYFLAIWGGSKQGIQKAISKIRNYMWIGSPSLTRSRVAWTTCCLPKKVGGLGLINPLDAMTSFMVKWIVKACKPGTTNLKAIIRHRLANYQSYKGEKWDASPQWFLQPHHQAKFGSTVWKCTALA